MRKFIFALALLGLMACQPAGMQLNDSYDENYALEFDRLNLGTIEREALDDQYVFYNDDQ